jgi:hypothetical protein
MADKCRAKYIEGLENRLARMESLMRLSGVLPEDDDGSTDLATLEKRLADRARSSATPMAHSSEDRRASVAQTTEKLNETPPTQPSLPSPRSGTASPEPPRRNAGEKEEDALAEMMCSLVTNNCGETRYIGKCTCWPCLGSVLTVDRIVVRLLHLLSQGHPMGKRQDRR